MNLSTLSTNVRITASIIESITNVGNIYDTRYINSMYITKDDNPSVINLIGKVISFIIGNSKISNIANAIPIGRNV